MHVLLEGLPIARELPGFEGRWTESGDWHFAYQKAAAGTNLDRMLAGLPDQACPVEHWGYVFSGRLQVRYVDGSDEIVEAGEAFHTAPGHRPHMLDDTVMLQVSRRADHDELLRAVAATTPS